MVEIVLHQPSKWGGIAKPVKSNPFAMVDFPELHSQKWGNP
jgi:hypothetical protein